MDRDAVRSDITLCEQRKPSALIVTSAAEEELIDLVGAINCGIAAANVLASSPKQYAR